VHRHVPQQRASAVAELERVEGDEGVGMGHGAAAGTQHGDPSMGERTV
jgi:hypothetical protein